MKPQDAPSQTPIERHVVRTVCTRDCPDTCGLLATVEGDRIVSLTGDPDHPITRGYLCYRGRTYLKHHYHPDRVLYPMYRSRAGWERISWDSALDLAAENIDRCRKVEGPRAILYCAYSGIRELVKIAISRRFFAELGGVTLALGGTSTEMLDVAQRADMGQPGAHDMDDVAHASAIISWGRNPALTHLHQMPFIKAARERGAPLVVVDPLVTSTARMADLHLQLRPGTDGLLALGVARCLIRRGAVDQAFLQQHSLGYEDFERLALRHSLAEVAEACDLDERKIVLLADIYASRKPVATFLGLGLSYWRQALENIRLIDALGALSGNLGVRGGGVSGDLNRMQGLSSRLLSWPTENMRWLKLAVLGQELAATQDPGIGMAWIAGANPVATSPSGRDIAQALEALPFVMVVDQVMTATAQCARLFLPCTTFLEETDLAASYGHSLISRVDPAAPPRGECRSDTDIFRQLAQRLGFGQALGGRVEDWAEQLLEPFAAGGMSWESLGKGAQRKPLEPAIPFADGHFPTPSGRFEFLTTYEHKLTPLPEGRLRLMATKTERMLNAQGLAEELPLEPCVRVHPDTAQAFGLTEDSHVWVRSSVGQVRARLKYEESLRRDLALINPARWQGDLVGVNQLREPLLTPHGEGAAMHETLVTVSVA